MPFKLLISETEAPTSGNDTRLAGPNQIVDAVKMYDDELKQILDYTGAVSDERALLILELLERDDIEEGRNIRVAELIGVGGKNVSDKMNKIARRAREIRRSRETN